MDGRAQGIVGLMKHPDCLELVALGVAPQARSRGLGGKLIEALSAEAQEDVFLATVIPGFFEKHAFVRAERAPAGLAKDPAWCEGCPRERCAIMVRRAR